jgi:metal-sulfur cluster biosynthetic enzyme
MRDDRQRIGRTLSSDRLSADLGTTVPAPGYHHRTRHSDAPKHVATVAGLISVCLRRYSVTMPLAYPHHGTIGPFGRAFGEGGSVDLEREIRSALNEVLDPCSVGMGNPMGIVDLGLLESWQMTEDGSLDVTLCLTTACCTLAPWIIQNAERALEKIDGVERARVRVDASVFWTPGRASSAGQHLLAAGRAPLPLVATTASPAKSPAPLRGGTTVSSRRGVMTR